MNDERLEPGTAAISDDEMAELIRAAGPHPELPELELASIRAKTCAAWEQEVRGSKRGEARARIYRFAIAAAVAGAMLLVWLLRDRAVMRAPVEVATVELVTGDVTSRFRGGDTGAVSHGAVVLAGTTLETGDHGSRAALRLTDGTAVRFDEATRATLVSSSAIRLTEGAIYVDSGERSKGGSANGVEVETTAGTAREIGTQFEVRVLDSSRAMVVRVREGRVVVERDDERREALSGSEVVVEPTGRMTSRDVRRWGAEWAWLLAASPRYDIEGRTLVEFLAWVERETGWTIRFADPAIELRARGIVLHGTIEGTRPDESPFAVLAGSGLEGNLVDGVLEVGVATGVP